MTLAQAIEHLRTAIEAVRQKRKRTINDQDIAAIGVLLAEVHRKDRL